MSSYTGTDNLEVMAEAVNYNAFLAGLVRAPMRPGDRVLDFGAGTGTFALPLAAAGHPPACVEPDPGLAARLRAAGLEVHASADALPPGGLDYAYSLNVLEHIDDDRGALARLHAALRPGGTLMLYVPAFPLLFSAMDRKVGHVRRYRRGDLQAKCREAGFVVERCRYVDSLGFFAALAYRIGGDRDGGIDRRALALYDRWVFPASRWLDRITGRGFGKNLWLLARRPLSAGTPSSAAPGS